MSKAVGKDLLTRYVEGQATAEEKILVDSWYAQQVQSRLLTGDTEGYDRIKSDMWKVIAPPSIPSSRYRRTIFLRVMSAAIAVLALSSVLYLYHTSISFPEQTSVQVSQAIHPGTSGATLHLADGREIRLGGEDLGTVGSFSGTSVSKTAEDELTYTTTQETSVEDSEEVHMLSTSKGQTYRLILSDGSKVWLNANSSVTFQSDLSQDGLRLIKLKGEAYFEVTKDKRAFVVETIGQRIEVLGTRFNVNAYQEEQGVRTTLLEGKVKILTKSETQYLIPGEQSVNENGHLQISVKEVEKDVAWKDGFFQIDGDIEEVMRALARWYDVDLQFAADAPRELSLWGYVSRQNDLRTILSQLERTNKVKFQIKGRTVTVLPHNH